MIRIKLDALPAHLRDKIEVRGRCWIWTGSLNKAGYGHLTFQQKPYDAHRFIYELFNGKTSEHLHHRCETKACVNPRHLEVVTPKQHMAKHPRPKRTLEQKAAYQRAYRQKHLQQMREYDSFRYYHKRRHG